MKASLRESAASMATGGAGSKPLRAALKKRRAGVGRPFVDDHLPMIRTPS
jgi:hypothetical protein